MYTFDYRMKVSSTFLVVTFLLLCNILLIGQSSRQLNFSNLDVTNGLPNNFVNKITQDSLGFIWIGTNAGLVRYDSDETLRTYKEGQIGLKSDVIKSLHCGSDSDLWIGTDFGGLTRYNVVTQHHHTYNSLIGEANTLSNNQVLSLQDYNGEEMLVGTEKGLNVLYTKNDSIYQFPKNADHPLGSCAIIFMTEDSNGWIWIGTWNEGMYLYLPHPSGNHNLGEFRKIEIDDNEGSKHIWTVYEEAPGKYWIGTHGAGLYAMSIPSTATNQQGDQDWLPTFNQFTYEEFSTTSISNDKIHDVQSDQDGNLWITTVHGLNILDTGVLKSFWNDRTKTDIKFTKQFYNSGSNTLLNRLTQLFLDRQGLLWIGSSTGVNQYNRRLNQFRWTNFDYQEILGYNLPDDITSIVELNDTLLLIGSESLGLRTYNHNIQEFVNTTSDLKSIESNKVVSMLKGSNGYIYIGTDKEIIKVHLTNGTKKSYNLLASTQINGSNLTISSMYEDSNENIWVGTESGLLCINSSTMTDYQWYEHDPSDDRSISDSSITHIYEDSQGDKWVTTYNGINKIQIEEDEVFFERIKRNHEDQNSIPSNQIFTVKEYQGKLYFGYRSGIFTYDLGSETFARFQESTIDYSISVIKISDNGIMWASCSEGVLRYDLKSHKSNLYGSDQGVEGVAYREYGCLLGHDNTFYVGGDRRLGYVEEFVVKDIENATSMYITGVRTINSDADSIYNSFVHDDIDIPSNNYYLSLQYVNLDYDQVGQNTYAYRLLGFENEDWQYTTDEQVVYTNLESGDYTFEVTHRRPIFSTNEDIATFNFRIKQTFAETIWSKLLLLGLTVLGIYLFILFKTRNIEKRNEFLLEYNEKLNSEVKKTAAANASLEESEQSMQVMVKRLNKLNESLLRSNEDLEQFAYVASHDLQEPLNTVASYTKLLALNIKSGKNELNAKFIKYISGGVERMSALIKSILTYSLVSSEDIMLEETNLGDMVNAKVKDLDSIITKKNATINVGNLPTVVCDGGQLGMVFYNLILNGIKFNQKANPTIDINYADNDTHWTFFVKDNGIGIHPEHQDRIFDIFQRLHNKDEYEGTGIGLSLCNKIIHRHDGNFTVRSKEGQGTEFSFTISKELTADNGKLAETNAAEDLG